MLVVLPAPLTPTTMMTVGVRSPIDERLLERLQQLVDDVASSRRAAAASRDLRALDARLQLVEQIDRGVGAGIGLQQRRPRGPRTARRRSRHRRTRSRCSSRSAAVRSSAWRASRRARPGSRRRRGAVCRSDGARRADGGARSAAPAPPTALRPRSRCARRRTTQAPRPPASCRRSSSPTSLFSQPSAPRCRSSAAAGKRPRRHGVGLVGALETVSGGAGAGVPRQPAFS